MDLNGRLLQEGLEEMAKQHDRIKCVGYPFWSLIKSLDADGRDILVESRRSSEWKQATEFALLKADAFFCDCDTVRKRADSFRVFSDSQVVQFPWGLKQGAFSPIGPLPAGDR